MNDRNERAPGAWVLIATIIPSSMAFIDQSAVNVTLPAMQRSLGASGSELLWFIDGYLLTLASLIIVGGTLGDRFGRTRVFQAGIALFTIASAACAAAPGPLSLIIARIVQGIGGALMVPGSLAIISSRFPAERRGAAIGTWSAVTTIAAAAGPVLGGLFADAGLWRIVFLINLPLGIAALFAVRLKVSADPAASAAKRSDPWGPLLITLALAGLSYGLIAAPDHDFGSVESAGTLAAGAACLAAFLLVERRAREPMVPLTVFANRTFTGTNLLTLFLYGALAVFSLFLPLSMVQAHGYSEAQAGLTMLPFVALLAGLSRWSGRLADRIGPRALLVAGPLLVAAGFLIVSFAGPDRGSADYWRSYFPGIVVFGIGMGVTVAPLTSAVMGALPAELTGAASGINNAVARTAGVLFIALFGAFALAHFRAAVDLLVAPVALDPTQQSALAAELGDLGNAHVPPSITGAAAAQVAGALRGAFLATFRLVMYGCAGCAVLAALGAGVALRGRRSAVPR